MKVGIGPGSICTTRVVAGIGVPQITAVFDAAQEAAKYGIPVIADGGIKYSGDIVKAFGRWRQRGDAGQHGGPAAKRPPASTSCTRAASSRCTAAMGSLGAMGKGSSDRYFQGEQKKFVPEGVEGRVPYKGPLADTIFQMWGGLRSGMGYTGCATIQELHDKAQFVRITNAGLKESHPPRHPRLPKRPPTTPSIPKKKVGKARKNPLTNGTSSAIIDSAPSVKVGR